MSQIDPNYGKNWNPYKHYKESSIAEEYDRVRFQSLAGRVFNFLEQRCLKLAFGGLPPTAVLCDVPVGTGRLAQGLLEMGFRVHGIDISPEMLSVAQRKLAPYGTKFTAEVGDARTLGVNGPRFDAALCARVLMHFPLNEQAEFLAGVTRATRDRVVFTQSLDSAYQRFRRFIKKLLGHQRPAIYPISNSQIRKLLALSGLREIRRIRPQPLLSEAIWIVAEPITRK
jgi:ubiquinone/menaquinone biosynthesis C-methylase UbiE